MLKRPVFRRRNQSEPASYRFPPQCLRSDAHGCFRTSDRRSAAAAPL